MRFPVSVSKITAPRFPHILQRARLIELLQQHRDKKLILILGPAAQGKSTLGVSWVNSCKTPAAWINLGPEDADPVSLFYVLVHSLGRALRNMDFSSLLAYPAMSMGPREELPLYREWALSLFNQVSVPVWFILNGLDQLPPEAPAYRFLQVLLDETPPVVHFLMLSREVPPTVLLTIGFVLPLPGGKAWAQDRNYQALTLDDCLAIARKYNPVLAARAARIVKRVNRELAFPDQTKAGRPEGLPCKGQVLGVLELTMDCIHSR
jgi:hypothetical protein